MENTTQTNGAGHTRQATDGSDGSATSRIAGAAHEAIDSVAARAGAAEEEVRERAAEAAETIEAGQQAAAARLDDSIDALGKFVRRSPVAAVGIAFAVGVVATSLLRR